MAKARVGIRLKEAIGGQKSLNRSADLVSLTEKYHVLRKKIHGLIAACKKHHAALVHLTKTRVEVADRMASITKDSPLFECAGKLPAEGQAKNEVCSYASVHHSMVPRTTAYTDKYAQFVINYAIEWDQVVTKRVSVGLAEAEKLRRDLDHYHKKVESIRMGVNKVMAAGKQVDPKQQERLSRNEGKLQKAKETYDKVATNMCILIEEVTERSWRDVHPMLVKMAQFDSTLSQDETKGLAELNQVLHQLKVLADKHELKPQARLKDIETLQPTMLSTRKDNLGLTIEADPSASGAFGDMSSPLNMPSMPIGSVGPQGSGGFPVQIASPSANNLSRSSSINSFSSGPGTAPSSAGLSTSEMMAISANAAPPPTMDQVTSALGNSSFSYGNNSFANSSFASIGGGTAGGGNNAYPPPLHPGYNRSASMASADSSDYDSSYAPPVPAPAAPPPPPPGTTGMSMYSSSMMMPPAPAPMSTAPPPMANASAFPPYATNGQAAHPWSAGAPAPPPPQQAYAGGSTGNPFSQF